jgi:hypothetical protein
MISNNLRDLLDGYGTDKGRLYAPAYEVLLAPLQRTLETLLEVGIGTLIPDANSSMVGYSAPHYRPGASLRAFRDYFQNAQIYGLDVQHDTMLENEARIQTYLCDSTDAAQVRTLATSGRLPTAFDVIIDDGSHRGADQLATLANLHPLLREGGLYFIEDISEGCSHLFERPEEVATVCGTDAFLTVSYWNADGPWKLMVIRKRCGVGQQ